MKRLLLALALGVLLVLLVGVGTATAGSPIAGEDAAQLATSGQSAGGIAGTAQQGPSNSNTPVRVLSPGDGGDVSQSNVATSDATAANVNGTKQSADQEQAGGSGLQVAGQSAANEQDALAASLTAQSGASNENAPVRVGSEGDDGSLSQSNVASSDATAANANGTDQSVDQDQSSGCKCSGAGTQIAGQSAENDQDAAALAATKQEEPSNSNTSVRVLSPGDDGDVSQSNVATSDATAGNLNATKQSADQDAAGTSGAQVVGQSADSEQDAKAAALTEQKAPRNENISVRVLSPGNGGSVSQSNVASSNAAAGNANLTHQDASQEQAGRSCGCGGGTQIIGQSAENEQDAKALAATKQEKPSNSNVSVRVLSPGDDGDVSQSNEATSSASAVNLNGTKQTADQTEGAGDCKCSGGGLQIIGQSAENAQEAGALAATIQEKPSNSNVPIRVLSPGNAGSVSQSNTASSDASAANLNGTKQDADQEAGGAAIQVIGQESKSGQNALAAALTAQLGASNENTPVRVLSPGDDGSVTQSNNASSDAKAANINWTDQKADQSTTGGCCGTAIQAIGQSAQNWQGAKAIALTLQLGMKQPCLCNHDPGFGNSNTPTRVSSPGNDGTIRQSNTAESNAVGLNWNWTKQDASQSWIHPHPCLCKKAATPIQAIGQLSTGRQSGDALAASFQFGPGNNWGPERKDSPGDSGKLSQRDSKPADDVSGSRTATEQSKSQVRK